MRLIETEKIDNSMELARPVYHGGHIMLNKGISNLTTYKERLLKIGITYVYINDEDSEDIVVKGLIDDQTRENSKKVVKMTMENIADEKNINLDIIKETIDKIINKIFSSDDIMHNLLDIRSYDSYIFSHCVNVAVLSLMLGKHLGLNKFELQDLGVGALLHDIGKVFIPDNINNKPASLTDQEYEIMQEHPRLGYDKLKDHFEVSSVSRAVVLQHHEKFTGNGYPRNLHGDEIHSFARIAAVADVFDALTSNRIYRERWSTHDAVEFLISNGGIQFDKKFVMKFVQNIAIYPNGTTIKLSNGKNAIVKEQNRNYPTRPVVKVIDKKFSKKNYEIINLMKKLDLVIVE